MKKSTLIILGVIVLVILWGFSGYNDLVTLSENADNQWAKVETQYQRRFDLIPNLISAVKLELKQEQTIFTEIAEARTRYSGAQTTDEKVQAASQVENALGRLMVIIENYPQLQSAQNVQLLMAEIAGTENRISVERMRFNDEVNTYNIGIKRFPKSLIAALTGFRERHYFDATPGAEVAPKIDYNL